MAKARFSLKTFALAMASPFCHCGKCPSYPGKKDPRVYCERAKSGLAVQKRGCICPGCPIWKINHFKKQYYCVSGRDASSRL